MKLDLSQLGPIGFITGIIRKRKKPRLREDLAKSTQSFIESRYDFQSSRVISLIDEAEDKTVKFLFELQDAKKVETVLIPFHNKYSVCLSSQVGCAMKCSFCHTGQQGLFQASQN